MRSQISKILETKKADRDHNKALKKLQAQQQHQQMDSGGRFAAAHAMEAGAYMDEGTERGNFGGDSTAEPGMPRSMGVTGGKGRGRGQLYVDSPAGHIGRVYDVGGHVGGRAGGSASANSMGRGGESRVNRAKGKMRATPAQGHLQEAMQVPEARNPETRNPEP